MPAGQYNRIHKGTNSGSTPGAYTRLYSTPSDEEREERERKRKAAQEKAEKERKEEEERKRIEERTKQKEEAIQKDKDKGANADSGSGIGGWLNRNVVDRVSGDTPMDRAKRIAENEKLDPKSEVEFKEQKQINKDKEQGNANYSDNPIWGAWQRSVDVVSADTPQDRYRRTVEPKAKANEERAKKDEEEFQKSLKLWKKMRLEETAEQYHNGEINDKQLSAITSSIVSSYEEMPDFMPHPMKPRGTVGQIVLPALGAVAGLAARTPSNILGIGAGAVETLTPLDDLAKPVREYANKQSSGISEFLEYGDASQTARPGENSVAVQLSSGAGSLAASLGVAASSGGTAIPAIVFGFDAGARQQGASAEAGKSGAEAFFTGLTAGTVEGSLESFGLGKFMKVTGTPVRKFMTRALTEGYQEFFQEGAGEIIRDKYESVDFDEAYINASAALAYGMILGGGGNLVLSKAQSAKYLEEAGMDKADALREVERLEKLAKEEGIADLDPGLLEESDPEPDKGVMGVKPAEAGPSEIPGVNKPVPLEQEIEPEQTPQEQEVEPEAKATEQGIGPSSEEDINTYVQEAESPSAEGFTGWLQANRPDLTATQIQYTVDKYNKKYDVKPEPVEKPKTTTKKSTGQILLGTDFNDRPMLVVATAKEGDVINHNGIDYKLSTEQEDGGYVGTAIDGGISQKNNTIFVNTSVEQAGKVPKPVEKPKKPTDRIEADPVTIDKERLASSQESENEYRKESFAEAQKMTNADALENAKFAIRRYVVRGDTVQDLKKGGGGGSARGGSYGIGDYINGKRVSTDHIVVKLDDGRTFKYKLQDVYDSVLAESQAPAESTEDGGGLYGKTPTPTPAQQKRFNKATEGARKGAVKKPAQTKRKGAVKKPGKPGESEFYELEGAAKNLYGKTADKLTNNQRIEVMGKYNFVVKGGPEVSKKIGNPNKGYTVDEARPALVWGGALNKMYTDSYIAVVDPVLAKQINDKIADKEVKSLIKTFMQASDDINFAEAEEMAKEGVKKQQETYKDQYPKMKDGKNSFKLEEVYGNEAEVSGYYTSEANLPITVLSDGKTDVALDTHRFAFFAKNYPDATYRIGNEVEPVQVVTVDIHTSKRNIVGVIMPLKQDKTMQIPKQLQSGAKESTPKGDASIPISPTSKPIEVDVFELSKKATNSFENSNTGRKPGGVARAKQEIENGTAQPIRIREMEDGSVVIEDGRHRLQAAVELEMTSYPIIDVTASYGPVKQQAPLPGLSGAALQSSLAKSVEDQAVDLGVVNKREDFTRSKSPDDLKKLIKNLNQVGMKNAITRRGQLKSKKAEGMFSYRPGRKHDPKSAVKLKDEVIMDERKYVTVLAHELAHAIQYNIMGTTRGKSTFEMLGAETSEQQAVMQQEFIAIAENIEGMKLSEMTKKQANYLKLPTEGWARYIETYMVENTSALELAPTVTEGWEKLQVSSQMARDLYDAIMDNMDKNWTGNKTWDKLKDRRQIYRKHLGKTAGDSAYDAEIVRRADLGRAREKIDKLVKDKFKNIKDSSEDLFRAASAIDITTEGEVSYGTNDYIETSTDLEQQQALDAGFVFSHRTTNYKGEPVAVYEKTRYTEQQAKDMMENLTPEGRQLIEDFNASKKDAKDEFNRNVLKDLYGIDSKLEGWVHHFWKDSQLSKNSKAPLKTKVAAAQMHRKGKEGFVEDFQKATHKAMMELETTKINNAFLQRQLARVSKPIAKEQDADEGWTEVIFDDKYGMRLPGENRETVKIQQVVLPEDGFFGAPEIVSEKSFQKPVHRYQIPTELAEHYKTIRKIPGEINKVTHSLNMLGKYWAINVLTHPGTAATNFFSGGLQYAGKFMNDFYVDLVTDPTFKQTRADMIAPIMALTPRGMLKAPNWIWGGYRSTLVGQLASNSATESRIDQYGDKALKLFGAVENYWKRAITLSEGVDMSEARANEISAQLTKDQEAALAAVNQVIDLWAYDYDNAPFWMDKFGRHGGNLVKPFMKYPYKYSKMVSNLAVGAVDRSLPWQERFAKAATLGTMMAAIEAVAQGFGEPETPEGDDETPYALRAGGRQFVGFSIGDQELFVRTAKYPWLNLHSIGRNVLRGNSKEVTDLLREQFGSSGLGVDMFNLATGNKSEFDQYKPVEAIVGEKLSTLIPGFRISGDITKALDTDADGNAVSRKTETFIQGFLSPIPLLGSEEDRVKWRGTRRVLRVPDETEDPRPIASSAKTSSERDRTRNANDIWLSIMFGIYVSRINPEEAKRQALRNTRNDAEAIIRELLRQNNYEDAKIMADEHGLILTKGTLDYYRGLR